MILSFIILHPEAGQTINRTIVEERSAGWSVVLSSICTEAGNIVRTDANKVIHILDVDEVVGTNNMSPLSHENAMDIVPLTPSVNIIHQQVRFLFHRMHQDDTSIVTQKEIQK